MESQDAAVVQFSENLTVPASTAANTNTAEAEQWILPAYIAYTSFVLFSLVLAVGVVGNVLVLIVILTSKSMRSSTNLFLLNLSIADLLVLIVCCPNAMIEMYMRRVGSVDHLLYSGTLKTIKHPEHRSVG